MEETEGLLGIVEAAMQDVVGNKPHGLRTPMERSNCPLRSSESLALAVASLLLCYVVTCWRECLEPIGYLLARMFGAYWLLARMLGAYWLLADENAWKLCPVSTASSFPHDV